MKYKSVPKSIIRRSVIVFVLIFIIVNGFVHLQILNQKNEEKLKAAYAAESTVRRIESQLNKYLAKADMLKQLIELGYTFSDNEFMILSQCMEDDSGVLEAIEIAKDGIVNSVYPYDANKAALGLNMLENPNRKKEAILARESGQYTIAGPYELTQGGIGSLLFDPIYVTDNNGEKTFWGFSIIVLNWDKFIDEIQLDTLESESYHYEIWKKSMSTGERITIAQCMEETEGDALEVICEVPNDTWYFEIRPVGGWISGGQIWFGSIMGLIISLLVTVVYWQFEIRRYRDAVYTEEITRAANEAKQANEAKTRFLFNMSHDIRTPMNAVIGFSELLEKHVDDRQKVLDYINKIQLSSNMLLSIINQVLEMARIESGETTLNEDVCCISEIMKSIEAVFEPTVKEKGLLSSCTTNVQHDYIICDETKVREIFLNVAGNSVKYTKKGGKVTADITELKTDENGKALYRITITDTGIGMSEEYLPHIFEAFTREHSSTVDKVEGTGLGLPIVKSLVELMNGTITVDSAVNRGTKTVIELSFQIVDKEILKDKEDTKYTKDIKDIKDNRQQKENGAKDNSGDKDETAKNTGTVKRNGIKVLLAEDNDLNAEIAMTVLDEHGFITERAENGLVCVQMLKDKPQDYYEAVLMDIQMPVMDGYEAAREIRKLDGKRGTIPIIAMTANAFEEDRKRAIEAGMNAHIVKPVDAKIMLATLRDIIGTEKK